MEFFTTGRPLGRCHNALLARAQSVISLRVLSRPDVDHLAAIYKDLGEDFDERVLPSIVSEVLKATVVRAAPARAPRALPRPAPAHGDAHWPPCTTRAACSRPRRPSLTRTSC